MAVKRIILKPGEERRVMAGHPWVYDNEAAAILAGPSGSAAAKVPGRSGPEKAAVLTPGECADVEGVIRGRPVYLGRAIVNPRSRIIARMYSPSKEGLDKGFFKRRIREALERRAAAGYDLSVESARIVFAEADGLPGLIIDRFVGRPVPADTPAGTAAHSAPAGTTETAAAEDPPHSWLVVQFLAFGMDSRRGMILEALEEIFPRAPGRDGIPLAGIIERTAPVRELEGLPAEEGPPENLLSGGGGLPGRIVIAENGLPFLADPAGGQKTGHFLDQRDNRQLTGEYASRLAAERRKPQSGPAALQPVPARPFRILDCFCYTGGFGITAGRAAAQVPAADEAAEIAVEITAVDASAAALELARHNALLNGFAVQQGGTLFGSGKPLPNGGGTGADGDSGEAAAARMTRMTLQTVETDVFDFLPRAERDKARYDLIILDPPAFAKNRSSLENAIGGYREINRRALALLDRGGILVTCSCSHAVDEGRFKRMICDAAADAGRTLFQLDFRYQAPDHPVRVGFDESLYLKCGFYRAM